MTILYPVRNSLGYYLHSCKPVLREWEGFGKPIYFRSGQDTLEDNRPTFFNTVEDAISAAEEMGFVVLGDPVSREELRGR